MLYLFSVNIPYRYVDSGEDGENPLLGSANCDADDDCIGFDTYGGLWVSALFHVFPLHGINFDVSSLILENTIFRCFLSDDENDYTEKIWSISTSVWNMTNFSVCNE